MATIDINCVLEEWKIDAHIDESRLSHEIIRIPMIHSKYLSYYIHFKQKLAAADSKKNKTAWQKRQYFRGEMDAENLKKNGWSQWNGLKPSATELNQLLDFDSDMNDLTRLVAEYKTSASGCEYILTQLKGREYALKSLIEYQRFLSGS